MWFVPVGSIIWQRCKRPMFSKWPRIASVDQRPNGSPPIFRIGGKRAGDP